MSPEGFIGFPTYRQVQLAEGEDIGKAVLATLSLTQTNILAADTGFLEPFDSVSVRLVVNGTPVRANILHTVVEGNYRVSHVVLCADDGESLYLAHRLGYGPNDLWTLKQSAWSISDGPPPLHLILRGFTDD